MDNQSQQFSAYYQAHVKKETCWLLTASLRSFEHVAFDRTIDKAQSIFEFFVPQDMERYFLEVMHYFQKEGFVQDLKKLPNRLMDPEAAL